ncbi:MAG: hypothetical protein ACUZ8E_15135 [Candidatus Anammoxibacter sp.]
MRNCDFEVKTIVFCGYSNDTIIADFAKCGFNGIITRLFDIR